MTPIVAVEAVRRTVARALEAMSNSLDAALASYSQGAVGEPGKEPASISEAADALRQAQAFVSGMNGPLESKSERARFTDTLLALDDASRLAEIAGEKVGPGMANGGADDRRATELCAEAMRNAASVAGEIAAPHAADGRSVPDKSRRAAPQATPPEDALVRLEEPKRSASCSALIAARRWARSSLGS